MASILIVLCFLLIVQTLTNGRSVSDLSDREINLIKQMDPSNGEFWHPYQVHHWPRGVIPFEILSKYEPDLEQRIFDAMARIENNTCIRFHNRTNDEEYYAAIINPSPIDNESCFARPSKSHGYIVSLAYSGDPSDPHGCMGSSTIEHELMHVVGLLHEHTRSDRDEYIEIVWENINPNYTGSYFKGGCNQSAVYGCPYTYDSVMHYAATDWENRTIIRAKDPKYQHRIQRTVGHPNDYEKINRMYQCPIEAIGHTCQKGPYEIYAEC